MTAGLATIRRGVGFGGLSTLSRGYLGGVALALLIIYPPLVALHEIAPGATGNSNIATAVAVSIVPDIAMGGQHPSAAVWDISPLVAAISAEPIAKPAPGIPALFTPQESMAIISTASKEPDVNAYGQHPSAGSSDLAPTVYAGGCC